MISLPIADIKIGKRYRKDKGDLSALAASIQRLGLLQPIVVTPNYDLIAGERRLLACRDELKWTEIDVRILDTCSLLEGEHDENELRKEFTISERVAIGKAIEEELKKRHGTNQHALENRENGTSEECPISDTPPAGRSDEIAAEKVGFKKTTYRDATKVVENAAPEIIDAMDKGEVSISDAAKVAELPKKKQRKALDRVQKGEAKTLDKAAKPAKPKKNGSPLYDWKALDGHLGPICRAFHEITDAYKLPKLYGKKNMIAESNRKYLEKEFEESGIPPLLLLWEASALLATAVKSLKQSLLNPTNGKG